MTVGCVGILLSAFLTSVASFSKFDSFEQNEHLKAQLENVNGEIQKLKEEEKSLMDQVRDTLEKRIVTMKNKISASEDALRDDSAGLQEGLEKLKAEYKDKEHCLQDWLHAHSKLKESVMTDLSERAGALAAFGYQGYQGYLDALAAFEYQGYQVLPSSSSARPQEPQPVGLRSPPHLLSNGFNSTAVRSPLRSAKRSPTRLRLVHTAHGGRNMQEEGQNLEAFHRIDVPEAEASDMDDTDKGMAVVDSEVMKQKEVITLSRKPVQLRGLVRKSTGFSQLRKIGEDMEKFAHQGKRMNVNSYSGTAVPKWEGASVVHVGAEDFSRLSVPQSMAVGDRIAQDPGRDKMEVIKENSALERAVAVAKSDAQRLFIANQKHNATLKAATRSTHWKKTYEAQEDNLKLQIAHLDQKCKEVQGIKWELAFNLSKPKSCPTTGHMWDFVALPNSDLMAIKMGPTTGTKKTEVHTLGKSSNYKNYVLQTGTGLELTTHKEWDFAAAPNGDLMCIKKGPTGSGKTEMHILSKSSNYASFNLHAATGLELTNGATQWAFAAMPNGDLMCIKKGPTGSGKTEVHILSKSSNYASFNLHAATGLGLTNGATEWDFAAMPNGDLMCIKMGPTTGSKKTEVHILSKSSNYASFNLHAATGLHLTTHRQWSFATLPNGDLMCILKGPTTGSGKTEVHILSKSSNYKNWVLQTGTGLPLTGCPV